MLTGALLGTLPVALFGLARGWPTWVWGPAAVVTGGVINMLLFAPL